MNIWEYTLMSTSLENHKYKMNSKSHTHSQFVCNLFAKLSSSLFYLDHFYLYRCYYNFLKLQCHCLKFGSILLLYNRKSDWKTDDGSNSRIQNGRWYDKSVTTTVTICNKKPLNMDIEKWHFQCGYVNSNMKSIILSLLLLIKWFQKNKTTRKNIHPQTKDDIVLNRSRMADTLSGSLYVLFIWAII